MAQSSEPQVAPNQTQLSPQALIDLVIEAWTQLKQKQPLVQCITNSVAANYVANML